jgi:DNA-binding transcriptional LysR family regulator
MDQSKLSPDDLILFATIAEQGSLVGAAERLNIPKATVSRRLSNLEAQISQKLLLRTTRRLSLTEFGQAFLEHCQRVAEEAAAAADFALSQEVRPRGRLRVSMPSDYGQQLPVSDAIATFVEHYPDIQLELDLSSRRVDLIGEQYDLAIRMGALASDSTLVARKIGEQHWGMYASPIYLSLCTIPRTPDDLLQHRAVRMLSAKGTPIPWRLTRGKKTWEGIPPGRLTLNSLGMIQQLLLDGAGIGLLPTNFVGDQVRQKQLLRILPEWDLPVVPAWAVMPTRRYLPAKTRMFLAHIEEFLSKTAPPQARA